MSAKPNDHPGCSPVQRTRIAMAAIVACACSTVASGQFFDGEKPTPITVPKLRERPQGTSMAPTSAPDGASFLSFAKDATVGIVGQDAVPGGSDDVRALLLDARAPAGGEFPGVMVLTDGERLPGRMQSRDGGPARWFSPWRAPRPMDTEGIRSIVFVPGMVPSEPSDADVVKLRNGDQVTGFVTAITLKGVDVEQGAGADRKTIHLAMESVGAITLAGPAGTRAGVRVWTVDGSVIDAPTAQWMNAEYLVLSTVGGSSRESITLPRRQVLAMQSNPGSATALASLAPVISAPTGTLGMRFGNGTSTVLPGIWGLDAAPIEVEGPVSLAYPASKGSRRLVAEAHRPAAARSAGRIDLVVTSAGKEIVRERLDSNHATIQLRADLPADAFEVQVLPVDGNAAGCFVVLERALLLPR